ncbi:hypothetical protein Tco_1068628 [Tanacetum coccineum]|uniref:Reverse transcriptase domain-containing protein n=1 Tax=Tanacetum coccineum TaxID=301880 RepID=A0ABQ5HG96_9ASTR
MQGHISAAVDSDFQEQMGRNLESYVDDMVIKRKTEQGIMIDIAETFDNLWKFNMKLNPKKCSFGVGEGNSWVTWSRQKE